MVTEEQKAAKEWLFARSAEGFTQEQIAKLLSPHLPPKGVNQATVGRMLLQCKANGYPTGITLKGITAFRECEKAEAERSARDEVAGEDEHVTTLPAAVQPAPTLATDDAQDFEPVIVEAPGPTLEERQAAQEKAFLARQAEVDRDIEAVYERLAAAGVVEAGHTDLHGDARLFHTYAIKFKYLDRGAEIVGFGPPGYECTCGETLSSHRSNVPWEWRLQEFAVAPGSDRPSRIGTRPTDWLPYEPCLDERWLRGEVLFAQLAVWRRARKMALQRWEDGKIPFWPSRDDIAFYEAVLQLETVLLGPPSMFLPWKPILDWQPLVFDHETQTVSMADALAHQHAKLRNAKRRARVEEIIEVAFTVAGYAGLLTIAALVATGVWVQDGWWSAAVSSPVGVLVSLAILLWLAKRPWPGSAAS